MIGARASEFGDVKQMLYFVPDAGDTPTSIEDSLVHS